MEKKFPIFLRAKTTTPRGLGPWGALKSFLWCVSRLSCRSIGRRVFGSPLRVMACFSRVSNQHLLPAVPLSRPHTSLQLGLPRAAQGASAPTRCACNNYPQWHSRGFWRPPTLPLLKSPHLYGVQSSIIAVASNRLPVRPLLNVTPHDTTLQSAPQVFQIDNLVRHHSCEY